MGMFQYKKWPKGEWIDARFANSCKNQRDFDNWARSVKLDVITKTWNPHTDEFEYLVEPNITLRYCRMSECFEEIDDWDVECSLHWVRIGHARVVAFRIPEDAADCVHKAALVWEKAQELCDDDPFDEDEEDGDSLSTLKTGKSRAKRFRK